MCPSLRFSSYSRLLYCFLCTDLFFSLTSAKDMDYWTLSPSGCECVFDRSRRDCACCQNGGCPCPPQHPNQCTFCEKEELCGTPMELNEWTERRAGCSCHFDRLRNDCACCKNGGCQCDSDQPHQCVACGSNNICPSTPTSLNQNSSLADTIMYISVAQGVVIVALVVVVIVIICYYKRRISRTTGSPPRIRQEDSQRSGSSERERQSDSYLSIKDSRRMESSPYEELQRILSRQQQNTSASSFNPRSRPDGMSVRIEDRNLPNHSSNNGPITTPDYYEHPVLA